MKKIKLFALAAFATLSINAFAADIVGGGSQAFSPLTYNFTIDETTNPKTYTATVSGLVQNITVPATVEIPDSVEMEVTLTSGADAGATVKRKFQVVGIEENAFAGTPAAAITAFTINAKGLATIGASAFAGTKITKLDLSKTVVANVKNWFGTTYKSGDTPAKTNTTLEEVTLSNVWTSIDGATAAPAPGAFGNCTALKTINFGKVPDAQMTSAGFTQTINKLAFENTILTGIVLSGTKVDAFPANGLLFAPAADRTKAAATQKNSSVKTVTLSKGFKNLNGALAYFTGLETLNLDSLTGTGAALNANELDSCIALKKVVIPANIAAVPGYAFNNCKALASVYFQPASSTLTSIAGYAFSSCAIDTITVPLIDDAGSTIAQAAFANCGSLTTFTVKAATVANLTTGTINSKAFVGCNDYITLVIPDGLLTKYETGEVSAPMHCKFKTASGADAKELTGTAYANGSGKYYVKYKNTGTKDIAIAAADAYVYAAYLNADYNTLDMIRFKTKKVNNVASYVISPDDVVLIVTDKEKVEYTTMTTNNGSTSWVAVAGTAGTYDEVNQLKIVTDAAGTTKAALETAAPVGVTSIYVWTNSEKKKTTGFQKLGSITNIKKDVLYVYANPAAGARLNIRWLDENGNVEEEVTAIQSIESAKAENGAIYNLAGQKVNAAYKGVVIKDGKKYMQK